MCIRDRVKTITRDRGAEFANWLQIEERLHCEVYFADPYCAWQKEMCIRDRLGEALCLRHLGQIPVAGRQDAAAGHFQHGGGVDMDMLLSLIHI